MNSRPVQNSKNNKNKYYKLYMKYKAEYLSLRKQFGGQVILDLMGDEYTGDNALEEIVVKLINTTGDDLNYKKVIRVNPGDEKGTIYTKDYDSGNINKRTVNRGEVEKLLRDIKKVWELPDPQTNQGIISSNFSLSLIHGDNEWPNGKLDRNMQRMSKSDDPQDAYDNVITQVLSFE